MAGQLPDHHHLWSNNGRINSCKVSPMGDSLPEANVPPYSIPWLSVENSRRFQINDNEDVDDD